MGDDQINPSRIFFIRSMLKCPTFAPTARRMIFPEDEGPEIELPYPDTVSVGCTFYARHTHIIDPHSFYVMPEVHEEQMKGLQNPGLQYKPGEVAELGTVVVFKSRVATKYLRGVVKERRAQKYKIFTLERGFTEHAVPLNNMYHPANPETSHIPSLLHHCELHMCMPLNIMFSQDALEAFRFFMGKNERLRIKVEAITDNKLKVLVYNSSPNDVASMLALLHYTCLGVGESKVQKFHTWKYHQLKVGQKLNVRLQHNTSKGFYVCKVQDYQDYVENQAHFRLYCGSQPQMHSRRLIVGHPVGVLGHQNDLYERAVITEVKSPNTVTVRLVDWGKDKTVGVGRVRPITSELFCRTPARAIFCTTNNTNVWENGKFHNKNHHFYITVQSVPDGLENPYVVEIEDETWVCLHTEY